MSVEQKLADALAECERLREENRTLRNRLGLPESETSVSTIAPAAVSFGGSSTNSKSSPKEKVKLFRGREDVYAVRWEGRNGKAGYSPAYQKYGAIRSKKGPTNQRATSL